MQHLHKRVYLKRGESTLVDCSHQCNVMIVTDTSYQAYRRGERYSYHGGHYTSLPALIAAPHGGYWNIVVDLGGGSATIRHNIDVLSSPRAALTTRKRPEKTRSSVLSA